MTDRHDHPTDPDDGHREAVRQAVIDELERILVADGPLSIDDLSAALAASSPELVIDLLGDRPESDLVNRVTTIAQQADAFWRIADGRLAPVLFHLRRAVLTHRLTADEVDREAIDLSPDLVALAFPRSFALDDGTPLRTAGSGDDARAAEDGSILGPPGWMASLTPGGLVAVRYDGEHARIQPFPDAELDEPAGREVGDALRDAFARLPGERAPEVHRLVVDTVGAHPVSFARAVAPLAELLAGAGLRVRGAWVGPVDSSWPTPPEQARNRRLEELLGGSDACCRRASRRALEAWHAWMEEAETEVGTTEAGHVGPSPALDAGGAARLQEDIGHGPVASVLAEVATIGRPFVTMRRLGDWATAVAVATGTTTAGVEYLRALGADAVGDPLAAEAHLHAGLEAEPDHPACLGFMAELVQDRGDAEQSLALLRRAGRPLGPETMRELEPFLINRQVGRNEPCPCGSGRKFKACCLRRPVQRPLVDRCRWLLGRAIRHAVRTDALAVQSLRQLFDTSTGGVEALGIVGDMLLFANPGLTRYLDARGALLAEDERACARAWSEQPMRLLEIVSVVAGEATEAIDLRTGRRLRIVDHLAAAAWDEGDVVLVRALPVADDWLLSGAVIPVPPLGRERALEMLEDEVRPFQLLQFLVDLQVEALRT